jgi:hypothetical protein
MGAADPIANTPDPTLGVHNTMFSSPVKKKIQCFRYLDIHDLLFSVNFDGCGGIVKLVKWGEMEHPL